MWANILNLLSNQLNQEKSSSLGPLIILLFGISIGLAVTIYLVIRTVKSVVRLIESRQNNPSWLIVLNVGNRIRGFFRWKRKPIPTHNQPRQLEQDPSLQAEIERLKRELLHSQQRYGKAVHRVSELESAMRGLQERVSIDSRKSEMSEEARGRTQKRNAQLESLLNLLLGEIDRLLSENASLSDFQTLAKQLFNRLGDNKQPVSSATAEEPVPPELAHLKGEVENLRRVLKMCRARIVELEAIAIQPLYTKKGHGQVG